MNYTEVTNTGPDILSWKNGQTRYRIWTAGEDCNSVKAKVPTLFGSALLAYVNLTTRPETPEDENLTELFCGSVSQETYAQVDDAEYYNAATPGAGTGIPTQTRVITSNPETFAPVVQWSNGKARITNGTSPTIPGGSTLRYWIGGQPFVTSLPTQYTLSPGDQIQIMAVISPTPNVFDSQWNQKSNALITIGPAPTA